MCMYVCVWHCVGLCVCMCVFVCINVCIERRASVRAFVFCLLVRSGNNIVQETRLPGSQGIVGNWKSRWTCMNFQEETVTTEIERNTAHKYLSFCLTSLSSRSTTSSPHLFFSVSPPFVSSLLPFPPPLSFSLLGGSPSRRHPSNH